MRNIEKSSRLLDHQRTKISQKCITAFTENSCISNIVPIRTNTRTSPNPWVKKMTNESTIEHCIQLNGVSKDKPQIKKTSKSRKQRITVQISEDVIERIKNAVYWTPGLTIASLAEKAFTDAVDVLEDERKAPFPKRKEELKTGRPIN